MDRSGVYQRLYNLQFADEKQALEMKQAAEA